MKVIEKATRRVTRTRVRELGDGRKETIADGAEDVTYICECTESHIERLVDRAYRSRGGMAAEGGLRVRILKREAAPPDVR